MALRPRRLLLLDGVKMALHYGTVSLNDPQFVNKLLVLLVGQECEISECKNNRNSTREPLRLCEAFRGKNGTRNLDAKAPARHCDSGLGQIVSNIGISVGSRNGPNERVAPVTAEMRRDLRRDVRGAPRGGTRRRRVSSRSRTRGGARLGAGALGGSVKLFIFYVCHWRTIEKEWPLFGGSGVRNT